MLIASEHTIAGPVHRRIAKEKPHKKNIYSKILQRNDLNRKLENAFNTPLTIVTSPMGYGKTTAVKAYLEIRKSPFIWITMTKAVQTTGSEYLWQLLLDEISNHYPEYLKNMESSGFPKDSAQVFRVIDMLQNMELSSGSEFILVIDDFDLIENQQIDDLVKRIAFAEIPWLRIVIVGRRVPHLPITEMVAKNLCATISFGDLTFSYQEALDYFELIQFSSSEEVKQKIYLESNGWISAMYLIAKSYFDGQPIEGIKNMLRVSIFDKYNTAIQNTLIKLSLFDTISVKMAVYIFQDYNIPNQLEQLCSDNAFIVRDRNGNYKFHQIFLNFLHDEQMKYTLDKDDIYRRAGDWFSINDNLPMAFHYWLLSDDYDRILNVLEVIDIPVLNNLDRKLILRIFSHIDSDKMHLYPLATLKCVFMLILYHYSNKAIMVMEELETYFKQHSHLKYSQNQILAEIEIVRTALAFPDMKQLIIHARQAHDLFDGKVSLIRKRTNVYTYGCPHFTYMYHKDSGGYFDLVQEIRNGFLYHIKAGDGCGAGAIELATAEYCFETGKLEKVELYATQAYNLAAHYDQTCFFVAAKFLLARLYKFLGKSEEVTQIINELEAIRQVEQNHLNSNVLENALGYLYTSLGDIDKVPAWLLEENITSYTSDYQGTGFNHIVYHMSLITRNQYEAFIKKKDILFLQSHPFNNQWGIALFHINHAIAQFHLNGIEMAASEMQEALNIAVRDHLVMIFAENAADVLPILQSGLLTIEEGFLQELIDICNRSISTSAKQTSNSILSSREIEILELLDAGISTKDIANRLYISQNTVKRHLQNIYRKLDVHNNITAIKKYRDYLEGRSIKCIHCSVNK